MGKENNYALILESEGGVDLIEPLQMHPNHQIYERALKILENYFQEENEGLMLDETLAGSS
jgi:importin subunit alpha-1